MKTNDFFRSAIIEPLRRFLASWKGLGSDLRRSGLPGISAAFLLVAFGGAAIVLFAEREENARMFGDFFDALWWSMVTIATVGYGDMFPVTAAGRLWTMLFIILGVVVTSILSGAVASLLVERRIREGKGLQDVPAKNHTILCGWNGNAPAVLEGLSAVRGKKPQVVLVNALEGERIDTLRAQFPLLDIRFVRGDFTNEAILRKASAHQARDAIVIPDASVSGGLAGADERTILGVLALKSLNPELSIGAELLSGDNAPHLRRAGVSEVMVAGELAGYFLSSTTESKSLPAAARQLIEPTNPARLREEALPAPLIGKSYADAADWFVRNGKGVIIGIVSRDKGVSFSDLLSDDSSAIDSFIRRKFQEAEIDLAGAHDTGERIRLAPDAAYQLRETDALFVIG